MLATNLNIPTIAEKAMELGYAIKDGGLLPICCNCGKARMRNGRWVQPEAPVLIGLHRHLSHGLCPDCLLELYPELYS